MSFFRWLRDICKQDDFVNDPAPYDAMVLTRCRDEDVFVNDPAPYDAMVLSRCHDEDVFVNDPAPYDEMVLTRCGDESVFVNDRTTYDVQGLGDGGYFEDRRYGFMTEDGYYSPPRIFE